MATAAKDSVKVELYSSIRRDRAGNIMASRETVVIDIVPNGSDYNVQMRSVTTPGEMLDAKAHPQA
jgi:hypothetical protein